MKIHEITNETFTLPNKKQLNDIGRLFRRPISVELARRAIIPHFDTPLLVGLLNSLEKSEENDIRPALIHYFDAEYPSFSASLRKYHMLRNGEGELSPLGHKDER